ncbi:hypothetical protein, partial [Spirosoma arboris]|uniref:hypothetical protein n=1 Tax=Spirosoma arboris TaxID=2682092 RepID=UPI0018DC654E
IRFVGFANPANSVSSHGGQIYFDPSSTNSVMEYVVMDRWGDLQYNGSAIMAQTSSLTINQSSIRNIEGTGINIVATGVSPKLTNLRFSA